MLHRLLLIIFFCTFFLKAENITLQNYHLKNWNQNSGLPMNSALAIAQTRDSYLWIGTERGLARFDGTNFFIINSDNYPELENDYIVSLSVDRQNRLWIGTRSAGIYFLEGKRLKKLYLPPEMEIRTCWTTIQLSDGSLLFGGYGFFVCFKGGAYRKINLPVLSEIRTFFEDSTGNLWVGTTSAGLLRFFIQKDEFSIDLQIAEKSRINSILEDNQKNIWIATEGNGLHLLKPALSAEKTIRISEIPDKAIRQLFADQEGNIWIGTGSEGIFIYEPLREKVYAFDPEHQLGYSIDRFFRDHENNIWIGSAGYGVYRLRKITIKTITSKDGLSNDIVFPVLIDSQKRLWAGPASGGLNMISTAGIKIFTTRDGLPENVIISLAEDKNGNIYAATSTSGIYVYNGETFKPIPLPENVDPIFRALYNDPQNRLWAGTISGYLLLIENQKARTIAFLKRRINALQMDRKQNLWIATMDGLYILTPQKKLFDARKLYNIKENIFISFLLDSEDILWIGALRSGMLALKNDQLYVIGKKQQLPDDVIYAIAEDQQQNLFCSCNRGIIYLRRKEIQSFFRERKTEITYSLIGSGHGLLSEEFNGGIQPAVAVADNKIYFPSTKGVVIIDPQKLEFNKIPPEIFIDQILVDGKEIPVSHRIAIGQDSALQIKFNSISFIQPEKMLFSWKLHNYDIEWSESALKREASYFRLPAGIYLFQVRAANNDGVWNYNGITIAVEVKANLWKKPLFIIFIYSCLLFFVAISVYLIHKKVQLQRKESQRDLLKHYSAEEIERLKNKIIYLLEEEKIYRHSDLSLNSMSRKLLISPRYLSQIINDKLKHNFNDLINHYRIQEAQSLLKAKNAKLTIIKIAGQVGFSSKSAFNRVFKQFTGKTPTEFIKEQISNKQKSPISRNETKE